MFRAAQLIGGGGAAGRRRAEAGPARGRRLARASRCCVGGRIGDGPIKLYLIYDAGNFIECCADTPFLQIGATQYGKPILDRAMDYDSPLDEAVKVGLLSFDSTIRSDLSVGLPFDIVVIPADPAAR